MQNFWKTRGLSWIFIDKTMRARILDESQHTAALAAEIADARKKSVTEQTGTAIANPFF